LMSFLTVGVLVAFFCCNPDLTASMSSPASDPRRRRRVVIDTDGGCDDAVAILLALRDPSVEVVAITTVFGNVTLPQATENVYTILRVFSCLSSVPFYAGCSRALVADQELYRWPGHGSNGLGDASFLEGPHHNHEEYAKKALAAAGPKHAAQALVDLSKQYPGELDVIALGPLTNIALAIRLDDDFASRCRSLTLMGGNSHGKGNATMAAEFNFYADPDAAHVVLHTFACGPVMSSPAGVAATAAPSSRVVIVPWEATEISGLSWTHFDQLTVGHELHEDYPGHKSDGNTATAMDAANGNSHANTSVSKLEAAFLKRTNAKYELVVRAPAEEAEAEAKAKKAAAATSTTTSTGEGKMTSDQVAALEELPAFPEIQSSAPSSLPSSSSVAPPHSAADASTSKLGGGPWVCCDAYAAAVYLHPELISECVEHYAEVITQGSVETRGMMAVDWYDGKVNPPAESKPHAHQHKKVKIVTKIEMERYWKLMLDTFQPQPQTK